MSYLITIIPSHVHSDHLCLGYLSIQEMIATQYSDPNELRCIHVQVKLFLNSFFHVNVADNLSQIDLPAKRCGIRMVYESELENFKEFPAGSNIFQHNHGDDCDALDPISYPATFPLINSEINSLCLRAPSNNSLWHCA